jgi:hypothetical protein
MSRLKLRDMWLTYQAFRRYGSPRLWSAREVWRYRHRLMVLR